MEMKELGRLKAWFSEYCRGFYRGDGEHDRNIALKEVHTDHVCANMELLASGLGLDEGESGTAGAVALFHDLGRFEQYRRFATFRDDMSLNHAVLGANILRRENLLAALPQEEQRTILHAVTLHNVFSLPGELKGKDLLFARLIRDADKLDIWRIFAQFYRQREDERASAVGLGFPDLPGCSMEPMQAISRREMVNLSMVRSLNDFRLLQLSWVFDLNFPQSYRLLLERGYLQELGATLPADQEVTVALEGIKDFAAARSAGLEA